MNLNIIGNGFDLYHGLPSSYYYFGCYLAKNDIEFYERMAHLYDLKYGINGRTYPDFEYDIAIEDMFWSAFEEHMGDIAEESILDTHDYDLGLEIEDYDIPMDEDEGAEDIVEKFIDWISNSVDVEKNYQVIKKYKRKSKSIRNQYDFNFCDKDRFLVFNYTHILQKVYGVTDYQIKYVHGECTGDEDNELIVGHGNDKRIEALRKIIAEYDARSLYQKERTTQLEYECLLRFIQRLRKDVETCMKGCEFFYKMFDDEPDCINVYGLSMGEADVPYLKQIRKKWMNAKWRFSYYADKDKERAKYVATTILKLSDNQYEIFLMNNPDSKSIISEIKLLQNIEDYPTI